MDLWTHAVWGTFGLSTLHLFIAVVCLLMAVLSPALRLPGAVCGAFYLSAIALDFSYGPAPVPWELADHQSYYLGFAMFDALWLSILLMLRLTWAAWVQFAFIVAGLYVMGNPESIPHIHYDPLMGMLNAFFLAALFLNDQINEYQHSRWLW